MDTPNANILPSSYDRISGDYTNPLYQPQNSFRIQNQGGNIVQGQMNKISVTELSMPYTTPTVVTNSNDSFLVLVGDICGNGTWSAPTYLLQFKIPQGFYTGPELEAAFNAAVSTFQVGTVVPQNFSTFLDAEWDSVANQLDFISANNWEDADSGKYVIFNPFQINGAIPAVLVPDTAALRNPFNYPNLLWTAGFRNNFATNAPVSWPVGGTPVSVSLSIVSRNIPDAIPLPSTAYAKIVGTYYTGRYTDYIDVVSTSLCQAQYIRDTTTSQNTTRRDVIARVYVCNNMSLTPASGASGQAPDGCRPFNIYRVFPVPKVIKWTADRSIDAIDLSLFDMFGQPLPTTQNNSGQAGSLNIFLSSGKLSTAGAGDYAITFHCHEPRADVQEANIGYKY